MERALRAALCCACVLALLGCSGEAPDEVASEDAPVYEPAFSEAVAGYSERIGQVQQQGQEALSSGSEEAVLEVYGALRDATDASTAELEELDPPAEVAERHDELIAALREQSDALDDVIAAAQAQDEAALTQALTRLAEQLVAVATIQQSIETELSGSSEPEPSAT